MTCIVGVQTDAGAWMGADSAASNGYSRYPVRSSKLVTVKAKHTKILFGYTSSFRFGQLLEHQVEIPEDETSDPMSFLVGGVVPALISTFGEGKWLTEKDGRATGGQALIGYKSRIYCLQTDMSVVDPDASCFSVGSGEDFALGAMSYALGLGRKPQTVLEVGLTAAVQWDPNVMPPFSFRKVPS